MATNHERKYNQKTGGFDYFVNGQQVDANSYTEANGGNWWNTLSGSNRKEDNAKLSGLLQQSGVADGGASKGVLQSQDFNQIGSMEDQEGFTMRMMKVMQKHGQDKEGENQLNILRKSLEQQEVTSDELSSLPVDVRQRVQSGNIAKIASDMGRIRQQMQGRANAKAQAFDFITNRYDKLVADAKEERDRELENFRYTLANFGAEAFSDWAPEQLGRLENELGLNFGTLNSQVEGARKVKAEKDRLRSEEIAREEARYQQEMAFKREQFERNKMESDRSFALQKSKASSGNAKADPSLQAMASFKDMLSSGEFGGKRIAARGEETLGELGEYGTREDAIAYYRGLFGNYINEDDIATMVYETFSD